MKSILIPIAVIGFLWVAFACYVGLAAGQLPERVATHFNLRGEPDGWMSRAAHLQSMLLFGLGVPVFIVTVCYLARFLPVWMVNIPHREHWLSPERRRETFNDLFARSLWLACLAAGLAIGLHALVMHANHQIPPRLSNTLLFSLVCGFLMGVGVWIWMLWRRFKRPVS